MPHLVVEYSDSLEQSVDMKELLVELHSVLGQQKTVDVEAVKSRLVNLTNWRVGSHADSVPFVHMTLGILPGRTPEVKNAIGQALIGALVEHVRKIPAIPKPFAMTLEIRELGAPFYFKESM